MKIGMIIGREVRAGVVTLVKGDRTTVVGQKKKEKKKSQKQLAREAKKKERQDEMKRVMRLCDEHREGTL